MKKANGHNVQWKTVKLGGLGYSFSGLSGKTIDDFGEGKPFIPYMNIFSNGKIDPNKLEYVRIADNEHQNKVEKGDWFFTTSSETPEEVGMTSVLVDDIGEAYLNSFCFGFRLYNKQEFDPEFASYLFRSEELRKKISLFAQGSTRYNLPKQQMFDKLYFSYPESLPAQRRIAAILSAADKVIEQTRQLIGKYKSIKQGMMEDLLKPKEGWKKVRLGEYALIVRGGSPRPIDSYITTDENGINWIKIGDIDVNGKYVEKTSEKIIPEGKMFSREVHKGDFILSNSMSFGRPYILKIDGCIHDGWLAIQNYEQTFDTNFLFYVLSSDMVKKQYLSMASGSTVLNLNKEKVAQIDIFVPSIPEQRRIAKILSGIDRKIEADEKVLEKYTSIKKGLMERLLNEN